jgi:hypothetical protein
VNRGTNLNCFAVNTGPEQCNTSIMYFDVDMECYVSFIKNLITCFVNKIKMSKYCFIYVCQKYCEVFFAMDSGYENGFYTAVDPWCEHNPKHNTGYKTHERDKCQVFTNLGFK